MWASVFQTIAERQVRPAANGEEKNGQQGITLAARKTCGGPYAVLRGVPIAYLTNIARLPMRLRR